MLDSQDARRKDAIPMRHQVHVTVVVASYFLESVAELLTFGEQLLEATESASHRVSPRVNDLGVGQGQAYESDMGKGYSASCQ